MTLPKVSELMNREPPVLDKDETLEAAWEAMEKKDYDKLVAVEGERVAGVLALRDIMLKLGTERTRRTVPGRLHISSFMNENPYTLAPDKRIDEAARMLLENRVTIGTFEASIGVLPVVDEDGRLLGTVSKWEIAKFVADYGADATAKDVMTVKPFVLRWTDRVIHARQLMAQNDVSFIPVLDEENRLMGYITVYEVAYALLAFHDIVPEKHRKIRLQHLLVHDVMRLRPPRVEPDTPLAEVAKAILEKGSRGAVVLSEGKIVGIVTLDEITKYVAYEMGKSS